MNFGFSTSSLKKKNKASFKEAWIYSYIIDTNTGYLFIWRGFYEIIWKKKAIFNSYEGEILHFHLLKLKRYINISHVLLD